MDIIKQLIDSLAKESDKPDAMWRVLIYGMCLYAASNRDIPPKYINETAEDFYQYYLTHYGDGNEA